MLKIWWWFQFKPWKIILIINDCCQEVFNLIIPFLALVQYILSFPQIFCVDKKSVYKSEELKMTRAPLRVCAVTLAPAIQFVKTTWLITLRAGPAVHSSSVQSNSELDAII